jgi:hypothetical protein
LFRPPSAQGGHEGDEGDEQKGRPPAEAVKGATPVWVFCPREVRPPRAQA